MTATGGSGTNTIAVTGTGPWTVTVSGVTLDQGAAQTLVIKYGDTSGGGAGATAPATTGGVVWTTKQRSSSRGALTNVAVQPTITVYAADGTGTVASSLSAVSGSQAALTETLTYTAPAGGLSNGTLTVAVPAGWTPPATSAGPGFTTTSVGAVSVAGQTITVTGVTRTAGQTVVITYGSGATATAPAGPGAQSWQITEASTAGGVLTAIAVSPTITIYAPDGSGTATTPTTNVSASQTGNTLVFTYTVATGDMSNGGVKLTIPAGWSAPSISAVAAGYTTSSAGTVAVAGQVVTISAISLAAGSPVTITYGSKAGGGAGATATATTGAQTWQLQQRSTGGGVFTNLGASPSITINAANGSGTLTASIANVSASQTGRTITFTYTAAAGGLANGAVTVTAPAGWSAPSTTATAAGYATASTGTVSAAGQTITVSGVTLAGGATMTVVYGDTGGGGPGATASATTGAQTWQAQEKSTLAGVLANLAASPSITVYAADGSGTATSVDLGRLGEPDRPHGHAHVHRSDRRHAERLAHRRRADRLDAPGNRRRARLHDDIGRSAVRVGPDDHDHRRDARGRADRRRHVRLRRNGDRPRDDRRAGLAVPGELDRGGGSHLDRRLARRHRLCQRRVGRRSPPGSRTSRRRRPGIRSSFTYTAAAGGVSGGTITLVVPAGWSAPSISAVAAGYTTSTAGTVAVAAQTITVSALTLAGGGTATITYGSKAGGGAGATATATTGAQTWQGQERSTAAGVLTNLAPSPSITINAANGTGTLTVPPANAGNGSTGNTLTFTYTAAAGGMSNGDVTVTAPAGWSAPSTTASAPGYTTASTGVVSAAGQTITVSGVTLAGGCDRDDRLRQHKRRRLRRNRRDDRRRECIPDAAALHRRRRAREHRGLTVGERLRGRRVGNDDDSDRERRQRLVEHDRLHVQGGRGRRHLERSRHAHRPDRLARSDGRKHDVVARRAQLRRADGHRLGRDARGQRDVHDHLRAGDCADDRRRADLADDGALDGRRRR